MHNLQLTRHNEIFDHKHDIFITTKCHHGIAVNIEFCIPGALLVASCNSLVVVIVVVIVTQLYSVQH